MSVTSGSLGSGRGAITLRANAGQVLGIHQSASRTEARAAYMSLLQQAANKLGTNSPEFEIRRAQLRDAYAAFREEPANTQVPKPVEYSASSYETYGGSTNGNNRTRKFIVIAISIIVGIFIFGSLIDAFNDTTQAGKTSSSPTQTSTQTKTPSPTPTKTPDKGKSGLLNSCWKEDSLIISPSNEESTPVIEVDCKSSQAQWRVFQETRIQNQCPDFYLTTDDGWVLCIRPA